MIYKKSIEIELERAKPLAPGAYNQVVNSGILPPGGNAKRISVTGDSNYLRILNDSVSAYLPYFEEHQMGGGYDNNGGAIQVDYVPEHMELTKTDEGGYEIRILINDKKNSIEDHEVFIQLFNDLDVNIFINSTEHTGIWYSGRARLYEDK